MSTSGHRWRIDPAPAPPGELALFAADGEHVPALQRLCGEPAARHLPDEAVLHLHAYELLERLRGLADRDGLLLRFPFWPAALFAAAGVRAHGADELHACMPRPAAARCALPGDGALERAARELLGGLCFDPEHYRWSLRACARRHGFALDAAPAVPTAATAGVDERQVAGAVLLCRGRMLLERRPDDARVYAGCWDTPGGHLEPGETAAAALARELREELGIEVTLPAPFAELSDRDPTSGRAYRHHLFAASAWRGKPVPRLGQRLCWLPPAEVLLLHRVNPLVPRALALLAAGPQSSC
jgi:mutator protein MutT